MALAGAANAQDAEVVDVARATLTSLQKNSFKADREYCGLIDRNTRDEIIITRPRKGRADSCRPRNFWSRSVEVLASYHTHGSHDPEADAEVPSLSDLYADADEGLIGFVSTPGGRFWIIEPELDRVSMICGAGCMPADPEYDPRDTGEIRTSYSQEQLSRREQGLDD